ncbi:acylphosphatase [Aquimarina sp. MAR_2010_214]|uniref:acylphosphatase n=1 Tax=Aquimarina sp. MAR_2010_214 TaxID=1250026 RepID=UPI000C6FF5BD|nr:acylphosphatase [Aquimarina sp. MAR_2010_214]PKV48317.1 acylphosphatase [Aquimarina sp. MAR_2010_214]
MKKHYNITVKGKVQGVWYRKSTQERAIALQINGNVRNLPNGNVYIEAEGNKNKLNLLLEWCAEGPEFAKVDVVSFEESVLQFFESFDILR